MKLVDFYRKAIAVAIANDPRGKDDVIEELIRRKTDFDKRLPEEKRFFDQECLENPYDDSRILFGDDNTEVQSILVGIDVEVSEILLCETLRRKGNMIDLVVAHHPGGRALAGLYAVLSMQADIFSRFGVPINLAESYMDGRIKEVERKLMPVNHSRTVDAARLLGIPLLCMHTAADNMVASYLQKLFDDKKPRTLDDIIALFLEIPEYRYAEQNKSGPKIMIGTKKRKSGRIFVDMTGGTGGAKEIFQSLSASGINTVVGMHISEDHRKEAEKYHVNVVIAGHIASDNLGMNLLIDGITSGEKDFLRITECSGFRRVGRTEHDSAQDNVVSTAKTS